MLEMNETPHYQDYFWAKGKPVGLRQVPKNSPASFRVLSDPYGKRFTIESYTQGKFQEVVYDSNLFDFRLLKKEEDNAWQREILEETPDFVRSLIRNMEERIILIEEAFFEGNVCRFCSFSSPHGIKMAKQNILLQSLGDPFNGVMLIDLLKHPILIKEYEVDEKEGEFTRLIKEKWDHSPT